MNGSWLTIETRTGEPVTAGNLQLIPLAQNIRLQPPGLPVGLIWNRPTAVIVQSPDGQQEILPVPDLTRQWQLRILAAGLVAALVIRLLVGSSRRLSR